MIIISDCMSEKIDEGTIKVANSLSKRIKKTYDDSFVISYGRKASITDSFLELNKVFSNGILYKQIKEHEGSILYIPFASNTTASIIRSFMLSVRSKRKVNALFVLRYPVNAVGKILLKLSGVKVVALSKESYDFYCNILGNKDRVLYLRTGIDTAKFTPVDEAKKLELRAKYDIEADKKVVLHVGHLKRGRNVDKLLNLSDDYQVVLVVSSVTKWDDELKELLLQKRNVKIITDYLPNIEEVYQMSDIYVFPVTKQENCIDIPLSVLEAASCNLPVICSHYGELKEFETEKGFVFTDSFEKDLINEKIKDALLVDASDNREVAKRYDWEQSIKELVSQT